MIINVNDKMIEVIDDQDKPLLWVLRENVGLCGTKFGCGIGYCGACTVLMDGKAVQSCQVTLGEVGQSKIITIEGLVDQLGRRIKDVWIEKQVSQCGYCQPGQIISAYSLLSKNKKPSDADIDRDMINLCRCGTYQRIRDAIKTVHNSESVSKEEK